MPDDPLKMAAPTAPEELRHAFLHACGHPHSMRGHMTVLADTASGLTHITEMGVGEGWSTLAWLLVQPERLVLVDAGVQACLPRLWALRGKTEIVFKHADTRDIDIEETDLLFIDTHHAKHQLLAELNRHAARARRYIVLHDTETFGRCNEQNVPGQGLVDALDEWLPKHPEWRVAAVFHHSHGLTVLARASLVG